MGGTSRGDCWHGILQIDIVCQQCQLHLEQWPTSC
ncbi:hypothetical protein RB213_000047 [Colletotrichum asianum]